MVMRLRLGHERLEERIVDRRLDVDPAAGRALLAAEAEGRAHDAFGRLFEVRPGADDGGVLAAHLDHDRLGERLLKVLKTPLKPISYEPVKSRPSTPSFSCSSAPTVAPGPLTMLKTPRGRPARSAISASLTPHSGASLEGL
jgi:hypothetical protein